MFNAASLAEDFVSPLRQCDATMVEIAAGHRLQLTRSEVIAALQSASNNRAAQALLELVPGSQSAWRPEVGLALAAVRAGNIAEAALQSFLAYAATGSQGAIELTVEQKAWLYIDGYAVVVDGRCQLSADDDTLALDCGPQQLRWRRVHGRFTALNRSDGPTVVYPETVIGTAYLFWSGQCQSQSGEPWLPFSPTAVPNAQPSLSIEKARTAVVDSLAFIAEYSPAFRSWVGNAAACYLLLEPAPGPSEHYHGFYNNPGLVALRNGSIAECCEALVGQSSYQHMLMYLTFGPLFVERAHELQYSSCTRIHQPVEEILCSAHVVGNLILFFDGCLTRGATSPEMSQALVMYRALYLEELRPVLQRATSLSEAGSAFWRDLRDQVDECVLSPARTAAYHTRGATDATRARESIPETIEAMLAAGLTLEGIRSRLLNFGWHPHSVDAFLGASATRFLGHGNSSAEPGGACVGPSARLESSTDLGDVVALLRMSLRKPDLALYSGFLTQTECCALIEASRPRLTRSKVVTSGGETAIKPTRTSDSASFGLNENALIERIERRVERLVRWPTQDTEGLQVVRYGPRSSFRPHHDFYDLDASGKVTGGRRQRIATLIMYLNAPEFGGMTSFSDVELDIYPQQGDAIFFSYPTADRASLTMHCGVSVVTGEKWIATKWMISPA